MKKTLFYSAIALGIGLASCQGETTSDTTSGEAQELNNLHEQHVDHSNMTREEHLTMVKAEDVQQFQNVDTQVQQHMTNLTNQYLGLKEALVASDQQQVNSAASDMFNTLKGWDKSGLSDEQKDFYEERSEQMRDNLEQIVRETDLNNQRNYFARLSKHTTELVKAFGTGKGTLYSQYCPMAFENKGGYWLSDSREIRNPFHPEEMLSCGRVAQEL